LEVEKNPQLDVSKNSCTTTHHTLYWPNLMNKNISSFEKDLEERILFAAKLKLKCQELVTLN